MSLPDLVPSTNLLPPYGSSRKEDNDNFNSIYYNPLTEVKREPLSPRIPTPLPPHVPTPIANHKANKSTTTMSPSTPLTEPLTLDNLWLGTNFRASYNVWGNTINNHKSPSPSPPPIRRSGHIPSTKCWNYLVLTDEQPRNPISPPILLLLVPPITPKPLIIFGTHNHSLQFPLQPDPPSLFQHPHLILGPPQLSSPPMSNQKLAQPSHDHPLL
ncbi:hypothetical protein JAAARDRAFT_197597 [Jaapia argillacea MUCL 33604]|uniref:Uncharacterized protein n=1 Tax=Jaapia argillacea MUCL 33604 TaxID=933084 RepID=A0A067PRZ6_9AGAM|nr:hypothetical protein JAAARDRAFT_197597 [Jaapia argillacea MUCL 33604]